jgi:hypothetical protein
MVGTLKQFGVCQINLGKARLLLLAFSLVGGLTVLGRELQFDVFLGYDGTVREASWFPVVCEIKNDGAPFNGVVEVSPEQFGRGQTQQMPVELPTGTLKRLVIPAFTSGRYPSLWNVRLVDDRGKVRAEQTALRPRRQIGWEIPLIGSLSRTASGAPMIRPIARDQADAQPASARFQPSIFPENPLVLEGMDSLYLSSEVATELRVSQVNALLGWLNAGGHLIVSVEQISDVTSSPWLRDVLPCNPREFSVLKGHSELQEWLRAGGWRNNLPEGFRTVEYGLPQVSPKSQTVRPGVSADRPFPDLPHDSAFELADLPVATCTVRDGRVVLASGGTPLMVTANRGQGRVTALLFSPEREPLKSWKNLPTFWAKLAEVPGILYASTDYYQGYGQSSDGIFGAMIDSRQVHKLPIGWLLILLMVYLVVIGPLDQWWLKRIGKPMLTWITFPCYVVLFSLLIYFIGYRLRAGETEYNELHVVDVLRNENRAELRGRTYASIYSPANERYPMESRQKFATLRGEFLGAGGGQATDRTTVLQSGDSFKAEVFVPVWTSQLYVSDWWQAAPLPLDVKVTPTANGWEVTVHNQTDRPVPAAQLVVANMMLPLGEISAKQTKKLTIARDDASRLGDFVTRQGQSFFHVVNRRQRAFGETTSGQISDLANASMAASFITQVSDGQNYGHMGFVVTPGLDLSRVVEQGNAVLLAWMPDHSPVKSMNQFKANRGFRHTLWRVPVNLAPRN